PALHGVEIPPEPVDPELAPPAIVDRWAHGRLPPVEVVDRSIAEDASQLVVTAGENVGLDDYPLSDHPLDRVAAAVDLGFDPLDPDWAIGVSDSVSRAKWSDVPGLSCQSGPPPSVVSADA